MKVIKTTVYEYHELSEEAQKKARAWLHESICDMDFEPVLEEFGRVCEILGIKLERDKHANPEIYYDLHNVRSASFTGTYECVAGVVDEIKEYAPHDLELHTIAKLLGDIATATIKPSSGGYNHEFFVTVAAAEAHAPHTFKRLARWLFTQLANCETHLYSDEYAEDTMSCNEYTFTEDGTRFG